LPEIRSYRKGTPANKEEQAILALLMGGQSAGTTDRSTGPMARPPRDEVDEALRGMGYNRPERERIRRGSPQPLNKERYRDVTLKRFQHHLGKRLPHLTDAALNPLVTLWAALTDYDLDRAQRWWSFGVDPGAPGPLINAIKAGLRIEHVGLVVHGRTIAEHLQEGTRSAGASERWDCLPAQVTTASPGDQPNQNERSDILSSFRDDSATCGPSHNGMLCA
jgi:hypothetical protein